MQFELEKKYIEVMWHKMGRKNYEDKLLHYNFINGKLLDIGCGPGQWSIAASKFNTEIFAYDSNSFFLHFLKSEAEKLGIQNISVIDDLVPIKNRYFDYVVCYNMLQYVDQRICIQQISNLIKNDSKVLFGIQGLGYYLEKFFHSLKKIELKNSIRYFLIFIRSLMYSSILLSPFIDKKKEKMLPFFALKETMKKNGFKNLKISEGGYNNFRKGKYLGLNYFYEVLASKQ